MAARVEIKFRCPSCGSKYRVPASAMGHKIRCSQCRSVFRLTDPRGDSHDSAAQSASNPGRAASSQAGSSGTSQDVPRTIKGVPTEEDILQWLSEADDDASRERRSELSSDDSLYGTDNPLPPEREAPPSAPMRLGTSRQTGDADEPLKLRRAV